MKRARLFVHYPTFKETIEKMLEMEAEEDKEIEKKKLEKEIAMLSQQILEDEHGLEKAKKMKKEWGREGAYACLLNHV